MKSNLNNIRLITLALIGIAAFAATAQDVTYQQAQAIAADFFQSNGIDAPASAMRRAKGAAPADNGNSPYYIINADNAFAIVAGDSRVTPILAYSFDGTFDDTDMAPGLVDVLTGYEDYIVNLAAGTEQVRYASLPPLTQGKFIPTATWNQNPSPWWDKCPVVDGRNCVAGCVATAMSIVMRYHQWPLSTGFGTPKTYVSSGNNITLTADFANTDYKIATIPTNGTWTNIDSWSTAEREAVATLLFHAGVAASMDYDPSGSGATDIMALTGIANHFGYKLGGWARKANYTDEDFLTTIIAEIDANRPTLYSGSSSSGGHMFVCDGYDTNYKLHFNFGWSGSGNGYYSILDNSMTYHNYQEAVIGITPELNAATVRPDLVFFPEIGDVNSFSISRPNDNRKNLIVTGKGAFSSSHEDTENVHFALVVRSAGGQEKLRYRRLPAKVKGNSNVYPDFNIILPDSYTIEAGDRMYLLFSTDGGSTWTEVSRYDGKNYFNMEDLEDPSACKIHMLNYGGTCPGLHLPDGNSITNDGTSFQVALGNLCCVSNIDFDGKIAVFLCDKDDNQIKMVSNAYDFRLQPGYYFEKYNIGCTISSDTDLARDYRLVAFGLPTGSDEWVVIDCDDHDKYYIPIPEDLIPTTQTVAFFGLFSTFSSKYDLDFSDINSFNAYAVRIVDAETLALDKLNEVKAGVGVLLMGNSGIDHYVDYPSIMDVPGIAPEENLLVGVLDDTVIDNDYDDTGANYVFKTSPDVGFFLANNETVYAGHAYMRISEKPWGAPAKFVFMSGDDQNGIISAVADTPADFTIYNLQGIPVSKPGPGIYIINGKKVIIK